MSEITPQNGLRKLTSASGSASTTGAAVKLSGFVPVALVVPASMASATISFEVTVDDGTTWSTLKDRAGNTITVTLTGGSTAGYYSLRDALPFGASQIRPVFASAETGKTLTFIGQKVV